MDIRTVRQRSELLPRREPYFRALGKGQHLGFRRTEDGGFWIARAYDGGTRQRVYHALGDFSHVTPGDSFDAASAAARAWFDHIGRGGNAEIISVREACARYVTHLRRKKNDAASNDALRRFERHVYDDPIASILLPKLQPRHVEDWRRRLEDKPAGMPKRGANCRTKTPQESRARSRSAINRDMVSLRAALNLALRDGDAPTDRAWKEKLAPFEDVGNRRDLYLDREQRRALVAALPDDLAAFVRGLCVLPFRPGALAALRVEHFDSRNGTLRIETDKAGADRVVLLPAATTQLFRKLVKGKPSTAPIFARSNGEAWNKDAWKKPIASAVEIAGLPSGTTAYTCRHSVIMDLVTPSSEVAGLDLFTVAVLAGTSVAIIEKFYGHLQQKVAQAALARLEL